MEKSNRGGHELTMGLFGSRTNNTRQSQYSNSGHGC